MLKRFSGWKWLLPVLLLAVGGLARAAPTIELDVVLDPQTRDFSASAVLGPAQRDFRFLLHEPLRIEVRGGPRPARGSGPPGRTGRVRGFASSPPGASRRWIASGITGVCCSGCRP